VFHLISLRIVLQFYVTECSTHREERKKGEKTEELCLGKPEMVSDLPRGHLLLSGDTADTMCN